MKRWQATSLLFLAVLIWGSTFSLVRYATQSLAPLHLIALRFWIASLLIVPYGRAALRGFRRDDWMAGLLLGGLLFVGFFTQTVGLSMTSAARGGFITGLNVVLVPIFGALLFKEKIRLAAWVGVVLAMIGLLILTQCDTGGDASWQGDLLVFLCAFAFAGHIVAVDRVAKRRSTMGLNAIQLSFVALLSVPLGFLLYGVPPMPSLPVWGTGIYLGTIATAFILGIQLPVQRVTSPTSTALIFSLEPVFAAFFAVFFGGEKLCFGFWVGGFLMLGGVLLCELWGRETEAKV